MEAAGPDAFARWSEGITTALLRTVQAQYQYPMLNYFYSADSSRALPVQIGCLLEVRRALEREQKPDALSALAAHPSDLALARALKKHLPDVEESFIPAEFPAPPEEMAEDAEERTRTRLLRYMRYRA